MSLGILIAPSGCKENLDANEAMEAIAVSILRTLPDAILYRTPGEGAGDGD